jgi:hypothetical protein
VLFLGFAGAFRRSELVALDVADIEETQTGLSVTIDCMWRCGLPRQSSHGVAECRASLAHAFRTIADQHRVAMALLRQQDGIAALVTGKARATFCLSKCLCG